MSLLEIENLSLSIGDNTILKDIDLHLEQGEVLGLVGESGSGKSMTALTLMQLLPPRAKAAGACHFRRHRPFSAPRKKPCAGSGGMTLAWFFRSR